MVNVFFGALFGAFFAFVANWLYQAKIKKLSEEARLAECQYILEAQKRLYAEEVKNLTAQFNNPELTPYAFKVKDQKFYLNTFIDEKDIKWLRYGVLFDTFIVPETQPNNIMFLLMRDRYTRQLLDKIMQNFLGYQHFLSLRKERSIFVEDFYQFIDEIASFSDSFDDFKEKLKNKVSVSDKIRRGQFVTKKLFESAGELQKDYDELLKCLSQIIKDEYEEKGLLCYLLKC